MDADSPPPHLPHNKLCCKQFSDHSSHPERHRAAADSIAQRRRFHNTIPSPPQRRWNYISQQLGVVWGQPPDPAITAWLSSYTQAWNLAMEKSSHNQAGPPHPSSSGKVLKKKVIHEGFEEESHPWRFWRRKSSMKVLKKKVIHEGFEESHPWRFWRREKGSNCGETWVSKQTLKPGIVGQGKNIAIIH